MGIMDDLIDFELLEGHKENIQPLASGRSARALAAVLTPAASGRSPHHTLDVTLDLNNAMREEYERELLDSEDHDDPLDIYNRYVKWTMNAYPSAQSTPKSQLLPLLERATKTFLSTNHYKNDPRYLKLWLTYIQFYSDSPRETFAFLSRHGIGECLALFYEEFAAWLEGASRWVQAEEAYNLGLERNARPVERLGRKYREFRFRFDAREKDRDEPASPALPTVRPALASKIDPFNPPGTGSALDVQASRGLSSGSVATLKKGKPKMAIFSDATGAAAQPPPSSDASKGWQSIGSIADRKKENTIEPRPWAGEILKAGGKKNAGGKLSVFKDQSSSKGSIPVLAPSMVDLRNKEIVNLRTGKREFVFADLHQIYPDPEDPTTEFSIDELRARRGGWLEKRWEREDKPSRSPPARQKSPLETGAPDDELVEELQRAVLRERNSPQSDAYAEEVEEDIIEIKAPKQKKMKVFEVQNEPQTIKTNLDSPSRPRIRRRSTREPTMTINTKAATDEVYDIFNQPLKNAADASGEMSSDRDYDTETDDYTSAGDTMSMGRSCDASEMGEGDEDPETTGVSSWSEFSTRRHVPGQDLDTPDVTRSRDQTETQDPEDIARGLGASNRAQDLVTPISEFPPEDPLTRTKFVPIPPADYEPPQLTAKDPAEVAFNRLPFMTPIVEMTELSMGALTGKRSNAAKTPCRKMGQLPMIDSTQETLIGPFWDTEGDVRSARMLQNVAVIAAADDLATLELGPSESPVKLNFELPTLPAEFLIDNGEADRRESKDMGPIIKDLQCNPVDESIKNLILDSAKPSLANYAGFNQYPYQSAARAPEIRKFIKSLARAASDKTISSLPTAPKLSFPDSRRQYTIKRELGKGAFAPVYLVDSREDDDRAQNEKRASVESAFSLSESPYPRSELEALKMEDPPSAWEFYITRQAHTRLLHSSPPAPSIFRTNASRAAASTIQIHELHLYEDECYLSMDYHSQGTLLDLVNISKADNAAAGNTVGAASTGLDETLAMFFTVELLRTVEALHAAGILHGDLKADNCLVRFEGVEEPAAEAWSAQYHPDGSHGWSAKGLTIIDFGRGIDMRAFLPAVQFVADWKTAAHDCAEMREMRPWTWQVDYHGLANVAHTLLFGRYIETVAVPVTETPEGGNGQGVNAEGVRGGKRYRLAGSLKRYWQTEIWGGLFDMLLNPGRFGDGVLLLEGLGTKREEMEGWLVANCEKGVGLRGMIRKFEGRLGGGNGSSGGRKK